MIIDSILLALIFEFKIFRGVFAGGLMKFNALENLDLVGKSVFLRLDLNVPMNEKSEITDMTRIERSLPTLKHILKHTNKLVIASHLGRPKGKPDPKYSLEPVGKKLTELLNLEVAFVGDYMKAPVDQLLNQLGKNRIILLENLRFYSQETDNDKSFAEKLAKGIDIYVDDAFGAMHRVHASVAALAERFPIEKKSVGFLVKEELKALDRIRTQAEHPFTLVIGGAKVSDKVAVLLNLINSCNNIIVGGAMAYSFLHHNGVKVGRSLCEPNTEHMINSILSNAKARKVNIYLPEDHICGQSLEDSEGKIFENNIPDDWMGLDIGPRTLERYKSIIANSRTIFWNGPMGVFEKEPFKRGTFGIAEAISKTDCFSVVGGGDSISSINKTGLTEKFSHISTGGGASLEYLEGKTLPGLKSLMG